MATDEAPLLAALMRGEPVTLARGTVIRLTRTLLIKEKPRRSGYERSNNHCECPPASALRRERQSAGGACAAGGRREG